MEDRGSHLEVHGSRFIDRLVAAVRKIQVASLKDDDTGVRRAQQVENFLYALFADWEGGGEYHVDNPRTLGIGGMTFYDLYIVRLDFCKTVRDQLGSITDSADLGTEVDKILKNITVNPFELSCPHWDTIAFEPDFSMVVEKGEVKLSELQLLYPEDEDLRQYVSSAAMQENASEYQKTVPYYHVETREYIYDIIGRTPEEAQALQVRPNPIGRPWYVFAAGKLHPEGSIVERYRPLLAPIYPVAEKLRNLGTLLSSAALQEGRTGYQLVENGKAGAASVYDWNAQPQNERPVLAFDLSSDALVNPPKGYHYENMPIPDRQILVQAYQEAKQELQDYGFPAPLSPDQALTGQASSGHLATREIEQANFSINPALSRLAAADKELCKMVGDIIKELKLQVSIPVFKKAQGTRVREVVTVSDKHFKDIDITLALNGSTASMDYAAKESDRQDLQLGLMSLQEYMTKWNEDPMQELTRIDQEKLSIPLKELAQQTVMQFIQQNAQAMVNNAAAELNIQIPAPTPQPVQTDGVIPPTGGPETPGGSRNMRPPSPMPGLGAPANPEIQSIAMEGQPV